MRKMTFLACAALLTSAVVFTSCKNDNENGPKQEAPAVKTEFSISMPDQLSSNGANRMPGKNVQKGGMEDFAGMTNITLVPYLKQNTINASTDARLGDKNIQLADLNKAEVSAKTSKAKVYEDVSIPLNTSSFLFYAKSKAASSTVDEKFSAGSLIAKTSGVATDWENDAPTNLTFDLEPIKADYANSLLAEGHGGKLLQYLTNIACATDGAKAWYAYTAGDNASMKALFDTYSDLRYLSSFGVSRVLTDLYKSLEPLDGVTTIATGILNAIKDNHYIDLGEIANDTVVLIDDLDDYPHEINLPDGAINIKWDSENHKFVEGAYANMTKPERFVYPAQLWYYVNSTIQTSNTSKKSMYEEPTNSWQTILDAHTNAVSVNSLTRAVAIVKPVQYAVARFDVTVKLGSGSMADNSLSAEGIATPVDVTGGFPVKAVFIGGQQQAKYDFTSTAAGTEYTIYDRTMANGFKATTAAPTADQINHTLVLENGTQKVRIAIELVNNAKDFYGYDNQLIPHGGRFYVCAELDPALADETDHHVFKQDFLTRANLTLLNLQKAYSTLPDLRTPQLELGFSVDLSWQSGHTYNINFE